MAHWPMQARSALQIASNIVVRLAFTDATSERTQCDNRPFNQ
jgi:hypothetical protein